VSFLTDISASFLQLIVEGISSDELLYRESESYLSHYKKSKHQCMRQASINACFKLMTSRLLFSNSFKSIKVYNIFKLDSSKFVHKLINKKLPKYF